VAAALGEDDCLLAGGLAVSVHGYVRATRDVDLITRLPLREARVKLERGGLSTQLLSGDVLEGGFSCLRGECERLPFDVLPQLVPLSWEQAVPLAAQGATALRAVALDDLLALKFKAQGPKDLLDAAILVLLHPDAEPHARELATAYRTLDRFELFLNHPRTRAQARDEARAGARLEGATRRRRAPARQGRKSKRRSG
jgi:hypothetical protein